MAESSSSNISDADSASNCNAKSLPELLDVIYLDTTPTVDDDVCKIISKKIKDKEASLVEVIETLGPRLTSTHVLERSKAVEILAHLFTHLPADFLSEAELSFIVDFLCDRCKDQHMVIPKIIMCALPIVKCKNLPSGAGGKLLEQLFREANVQSHIHKIRHTFFKTLQCLLGKRLTELQEMSSDFVMNFLQSMDGEKDPRNLLLLFRIIPSVIGNFKLDPFIEDFFEILSCYFPIDFNPTVSMPGEEKITRKDLAQALHICLSQTNEFSEFLLPLIMEKLESSAVDAKLDSLELLQLCCERSYTPQDLEPHLSNIWHAMRREIFMGGDFEVEKKCYEFLTAAFKMVSRDNTILNTCLAMIYSECKHHLSEPELRLIMPTSNILRCISESGEVACISVVQALFPVLYEQICLKSTKSEKKRLLEIWGTLISTCRQYKSIQLHSLVAKWDEMRGLWFTLLTNDDWELVTAALKIFTCVIVNDADFPVQHRTMLLEHLLPLIRSSFTMPQDARSALISVCCHSCRFYGEEFSTATVPRLLDTLSHSTSPSADAGGLCDNNCEENMQCQVRSFSSTVLGECSHLHPSVFEKVVCSLLEKLTINPLDLTSMKCLGCIMEKACKPDADESPKTDLLSLFTSLCIQEKVISITFEICKLLKSENGLMHLTTHVTAAGEKGGNLACWESIRQATYVLRNIFRASSEAEQSACVQKYWNDKVKGSDNFEPQLQCIPGLLVEAILGPSRRTVEISLKKDLIHYILEKVLSNENTIKCETSQEFDTMPFVRLLASFINKVINEEELEEYLRAAETYFEKFLAGKCKERQSSEQKANDMTEKGSCSDSQAKLINSMVWIVKALAMRSYRNLELWVEKIMMLLRDEKLGNEVVKYFPYLVADDSYSLNEASFCLLKLFYKQRLFLMVVDKLVSGYRNASSQEIQFNFIRALSSQLKHVPSEILFMKIDSVLPLLVASLKCNSSSQVLLSSLTALMEMMQSPDTKHKLTEYCHDLVPQLVRLAQYKDSMEVRRESLSCLRKCARAPNHLILPLRDSVIDNLVPCLDDPKRLVRKEAALTKNIWTLIGAPGGL